MPDVDLEAVVRSKGLGDGAGPRRSHLPRRAALRTVEVAVLRRREDVELLAAIGAVAVAEESELLQDVERPIDRRRRGRRVARAATLHQVRPGDVAVGRGEHLDHRSPLRRPAEPTRTQALVDGGPWGRKGSVDVHRG